jgi:hypothetical protein
MVRQIEESDWKLLRQLAPIALDRFCKSALAEIERVTSKSTGSNHKRFLEVFRLVGDRNDELARAFDDHRRSNAFEKLAILMRSRLLTQEEFSRFGSETRAVVELYLG